MAQTIPQLDGMILINPLQPVLRDIGKKQKQKQPNNMFVQRVRRI